MNPGLESHLSEDDAFHYCQDVMERLYPVKQYHWCYSFNAQSQGLSQDLENLVPKIGTYTILGCLIIFQGRP